MRLKRVLLLLLLGAQIGLYGQNSTIFVNTAERPAARASQLANAPTLDGNVMDDPAWQAVTLYNEMWQSQPNAGQPATEKTEIRIAYDATNFYVGVICYDADPEALVVSDARRDASLAETDAFSFILDTYNDGQNGFVFGTNPIGIEYDAQVNNEGQGNFSANRQQGGQVGGFNLNWDASWEVKTEVGDYGWSAEFAIPLRTLRFASGENVDWGINFRRNIRKTNEIAYWASLPYQFNLNRLSLAGKLQGLSLQSPGNLKVIPYVLGRGYKDFSEKNAETVMEAEAGVDVKYSITPSLTLDLTYNTDFAQVEVDDQQVNLDRFNLFFPEKRPFFLENAGFFAIGSPGEVDLFFSRRIGIGEGGSPVPIIGGARLSGRVNKTNVGFLSMFTEEVADAGVNPNNFTVARVSHEFAKRSAIGGAFINRQGTAGEADDYNRTVAVDGRWGLGKKAQISGFYGRTMTPGVEDDAYSFRLQTAYEWQGLDVFTAYSEVGEGFNPEVGFLARSAFRKPEFRVLKRIRPNGKFGLLELRPHVSYRSYWGFDNFLQTSFLHVDNHWEWMNGLEIHTGVNFTVEGVQADFEIAEGVIVPAGTYRHEEAQLVFITNPSKMFSISTRHVLGGFFGGKRYNNRLTLNVIFGDKFNGAFTLSRNDIELENGKFNTNIFQSRLSYSFTPRIFTQSLIQYNSLAELWSANIRFGWLQQANTGLFLVYNQVHRDGLINNRSFTIKYTRMFDVLR